MESPEEQRPCNGHSQSPDSPVEEVNLYCKVIKTVAMKVKRSETIKNLKAMLCKKENVSENFQELFLSGERLEDGKALFDCGINKDSTLHFVIHSLQAMKIFVKIPSKILSKRKTITLEVKTWETIQNIKTMIQTEEGIQSDRFSLYFTGEQLNDDSTLASHNIMRESTLHVVFNPGEALSIWVKTQAGTIKRLKVRLLHAVEDITAIVENVTGIPICTFCLTYGGKRLQGWKTLAYYDVKEESILEISPAILIYVKVLSRKIERTWEVIIRTKDTVKDLMELISERIEIPVNDQIFYFCQCKLKEEHVLASRGVQKESTIELRLRSES